jgi:hypothetical protein
MKKFFKIIWNLFASFLGMDCEWRREAIDAGVLDLSGQGRDKNGR